jgi:hypothetical protein
MMVRTIPQRAGEPVEFPYHEHIAFAELTEKAVQFGPVPASTGSFLAINALTPGGLECRDLGYSVLLVGRDSRVANDHCAKILPMLSIKQYLFATHKPAYIASLPIRCTNDRFCKR